MKKNDILFSLVVILTFAIVGAFLSIIFSRFIDFGGVKAIQTSIPKQIIPAQKDTATKQPVGVVAFNPPVLQDAPADIKNAVMLGYNIMMDTSKYAAGYVGNKLKCANCHFNGGITEGGKNGGLSLVGVAATYPKYRRGQDYAVDLITQTNDCFERSMNGKPLPPESKEMTAIITYYQWISRGLPIYADIRWLGLEDIQSAHSPDPVKGKQVFAQRCAMCHGNSGEGTQIGPPVWGNDSFNDGAGMHQLENLAAFSHENMPKGNPDLTAEDALDTAAYVTSQPRNHFVLENK
jgi:thiosulfate dehydrogenase